MKKSQKGFTLVELIVVIAIIGVLAAILVPAMVGYIKDSKLSSANSSAKTVYTAVNAICQKVVNAGGKLTTPSDIITLDNAGESESPTASDYLTPPAGGTAKSSDDMIKEAIESSLNKDAQGSVAKVFIGTNGFPTDVAWAKGEEDEYVGAYPTPTEDTFAGGIADYTEGAKGGS